MVDDLLEEAARDGGVNGSDVLLVVDVAVFNQLVRHDVVSCSAYIRPSGNHFEIDNEDTGTALLWEKDATEGREIEDYESCDKFVTKTALFTGVFVGVTWLCTELFCEWNEPPYGRSGFQCSSTNPKPFAIVYYAENKKRLVPMDSIEKVER